MGDRDQVQVAIRRLVLRRQTRLKSVNATIGCAWVARVMVIRMQYFGSTEQ